MRSHLFIVDFKACVISVVFRKFFSMPKSSSICSTSLLSNSGCQALCRGLWSTWSWLLCRVGDNNLVSFFFSYWSSLNSIICENAIFSLLCIFGLFIKKNISWLLSMCIYICTFNYILLINESVFVPVPLCFYDCNSIV